MVAPSGLGKTSEMIEEVKRLRARGRLALFLSARAVVEDRGQADALARDSDELAKIRAWLPSAPSGEPRDTSVPEPQEGLASECPVIFLDAVDEVVLAGRNVGVAFPFARRLLGEAARRCQWVVSARGGWSNQLARALLRELVSDPTKSIEPRSLLRDVTFDPLDANAIRELAKAAQCRGLDAFLGALRASEIESHVELRPMDVASLVARWNRLGALGTWAEIYDDYVRTALTPSPESRDDARTLTVDAARHGAERVGAATIFAKTPFLSVPTIPTKTGTIGSRELFADWTTRATRELLETALFHKKGDDSLQLQPGEIPAFLAASWLAARARGGRDVRWLRVGYAHGAGFQARRHVLPASRRDGRLGGVLGAGVSRSRKKAPPSVVLYQGDPDRLSDDEVLHWLDAVLARIGDEGRPWVTRGTVMKLARPSLEAGIVSRLHTVLGSDARELLFRLARERRYTTALPVATAVAKDTTNDTWLRVAAIGLVAACEDAPSRKALEALMADEDVHVRDALVPVLLPRLRGETLVAFLLGGGSDSFAYRLEEALADVPTDEVELAVTRMLSALREESGDSKSVFAIALEFLRERLRRAEPCVEAVVEFLLEIEESRGRVIERFVSSDVAQELERAVSDDQELRRALWRARFFRGRPNETLEAVFRAEFAHQDPRDLDWLLQLGDQQVELADAARYAARTTLDGLRDDALASLRTTAGTGPVGAMIDELQRTRTDLAHRRRAHERKQAEGGRASSASPTSPHSRRDVMRSHEERPAPSFGRGDEHDPGDRESAHQRFTPLVGSVLADDFVRGIACLWRRQDVEVRDPEDRSLLERVTVALAGIGYEVEEGLDLRALDPALARRAARYALYSLNALPDWFGALLDGHEKVAREVLRDLARREWNAKTNPLSILRFAPYASSDVAEELRTIARDLLSEAESKPPNNPEALESAVTAVLTGAWPLDESLAVIARVAAKGLPATDPRRTTWLRLWAHLDPTTTVRWLARLPRAKRRDTVVEVAAALEKDLERRRVDSVSRVRTPRALALWAALLFRELPPDQDVRPNGVVKPRHDAQDMRDWCLRRLHEDPSPAARAALEWLVEEETFGSQPGWGERLLAMQHASAAEHAAVPWSERMILALEQEDEATPHSLPELFGLVRRHLDDVARLVAPESEFSYRELFDPDVKEREIQLWAASSLQLRARGLYTILRENVVAHDKEVDITAAVPGVGQVPIEIKPANRYTLTELQATIRDQLVGRYMTQHDRTKGVLLLVAHAPKTWRSDGQMLTYRELVERLQTYARALGTNVGKEIAVHAIDVASSRPTKARKPGRKARR
ncbi:MAG: hypothetical protein R3B99_19640 [Polyangiales bacterium]